MKSKIINRVREREQFASMRAGIFALIRTEELPSAEWALGKCARLAGISLEDFRQAVRDRRTKTFAKRSDPKIDLSMYGRKVESDIAPPKRQWYQFWR